MNFLAFLNESEEEEKNVRETIAKLPKSHQKLLRGFKVKFVPGNTLKGDNKHIGVIDGNQITVAAPWRYGREWVFLHEVSHLIFEKLVTKEQKKEWSKVAKMNPRQNQDNDEENFAMAYANHFAKHKILTHNHPAWEAFMKKLCGK